MRGFHGVGRIASIALSVFAVSVFGCRDTASPDRAKINNIGSANYAAIPGPDLVAAYGFNEASGTVVTDVSLNNNSGSFGGGVSRVASGKFGGALAFNGGGMVTVPNTASLGLAGSMTLEAWVNPTAINGDWRDVVYKGNDNYYLMGTSTRGSRSAAGITLASNGAQRQAFGSRLVVNVWTHLAMTYDGASVRLYMNGSQVSSTAASGAVLKSSNPLTIGGDAIYGQFFQGSIDEVRIYSRALSAAEIRSDMNTPVGETPPPPPDTQKPSVSIAGPTSAASYTTSTNTLDLSGVASDNVAVTQVTWSNDRGGSGTAAGTTNWSAPSIPLQVGTNVVIVTGRDAANNAAADTLTVTLTAPPPPPGPAGLVAAYAFNEASGTTVNDASTSGNSGTMGSGVTRATGGKFGGALSFNGSGMVTIPHSSSLNLTNAMTLEAWVNPAAVVSDWTDVVVKGKDNYYLMATSTQGSKPVAGVTFAGNCCTSKAIAPAPLAANTWTHLAATYDGTSLRLYVNGSLVATLTSAAALATSTTPLQIGGDQFYGQFFRGLIDEVRLYNRALSAAELQSDMNTPVGGSPPPPPPPPPPAADTIKPTVSITTPGAAGTYTVTSSPLSVAGAASDNVGVTQVSWSNSSGGSGVASGTTSWSASVALQAGTNVVTVSAKDSANNTSSATITVTYNPPTAPTPTSLFIQTQPSSSAQSGVAFAQQPVIQLRDASNNPISKSGVSVTAAIASGGGTLGGTATVTTNASGVAAFSNLSITGTAGTRTLGFSAASLTGTTSNVINITVPANSPPPPGTSEPVFNASVNTMVYQDNMDQYTSPTTMGATGQTGPRITPNPSPMTTSSSVNTSQNQLITGRDGSGKALRLGFSGGNQTSATYITWNMPSTPKLATHTFQYWARVGFSSPFTGTLAVKWFEAWHASGVDRVQWNTHDHLPCPTTGHSTYWQVYDQSRETTCQGNQPVGPYLTDVTDGQWHRFTYQYRPNSSAGARDGFARMWIDGTKIIDISAATIGVTPAGGDKPWCLADDVDKLAVNDGISNQFWGSTQTTVTPSWTYDIDDYLWWIN